MRKMLCFLLICVLLLPFDAAAAVPQVSAKAAVLLNAATGGVVLEYNGYARLPMASTTKIMTALLLAEQPDLSKAIVTTAEMVTVEGSSMGLKVGDTVTLHDLLYGMLLASGNDAANTTAIALAGSVEAFAARMNEKAAALGLRDTHFVTPSGLDDAAHYTTAYDLARLAMAAMENPVFAQAAGAKSASLCYGNPPYDRTLTNHNKLLSLYEGCIGVKTGFTKKSGRCLVSAAQRDGVRLIAVTLNDPDDWSDHQNLLDYGFDAVQCLPVTPIVPQSVALIGGQQQNLPLAVQSTKLPLLRQEVAKLQQVVYIKKLVYAPVAAGEIIGRVELYYGEKHLADLHITAGQSVAQDSTCRVRRDWVYYIRLLLRL